MSEYETGYQALGSFYDDDQDEGAPVENIIHVVPDTSKVRWNHIEDLDEFFTRVYQYHQRNGFANMILQDLLQLLQFMFVVLFSVFLINCVDYDVLFYEKQYNGTHKVTLGEAVYPVNTWGERIHWFTIICLIMASLFWLFRSIKLVYNIFKYLEIRAFFSYALKITPGELGNMTWHDIQKCLLEVQKEQQMCIHKQELTELDIYHRIMRFKNYMVAMVNKSLLQFKYRLPFMGDYMFLSTGLKYNLEMILFWGPWSPFENNWHLKSEYKNQHSRKELSDTLAQRILWIGLANLVLSPLIFMWQILYSFFRYAEIMKREPSFLGSRRWSLYSRLYLRHFNELDHEFNARLNRAYKPAERYMNIFTSPFLETCAKHMTFFAGSILAVFIILTVVDEDILGVEHVISIMTVLGIIVTVCQSCIPDEHLVWCPELLMRSVLSHTHYMPDKWKGNAHTYGVRDEFSQLFQYKVLYLLEELASPIITPLVLLFCVRQKSQDIVDFYRNFTVEVTGVGDVCSFAQMDIRKHGNPQWLHEGDTEANQYHQAEDGKTELSLVHFTLTNPEWRPPEASSVFLHTLKEQAHKDATMMSMLPQDHPLVNSLHSMSSLGYGYTSMMSSINHQSILLGGAPAMPAERGAASAMSPTSPISASHRPLSPPIRGGVKNSEGPIARNPSGLLASVAEAVSQSSGSAGSASQQRSVAFSSMTGSAQPNVLQSPFANRGADEEMLELLSQEMSFSALYMHELHHRRLHNPYYDNYADMHARALWQSAGPSSHRLAEETVMPNIPESQNEEDELQEAHPLIGFNSKSSDSPPR